MKKFFAVLALILGLFVVSLAPVEASVARGPQSDAYHQNIGNNQAFGVYCSNGQGPFWVQKGQFAWNKCWDLAGRSSVASIYMPANFRAWCKKFGSAGTWNYLVPGGANVSIWGNEIYECYTQHY